MAVTERLDTAPLEKSSDDTQTDPAIERVALVVENLRVTYRLIGPSRAGADRGRDRESRGSLFRRRGRVGGVTKVEAVRGVSFVAGHGETIGIVGVNGSGKSTLLRAVAGLVPATSGSIYSAAQPAFLGVNAALIRDLSGERNIMIGGLALGLSRQEIREKFDDIVDFSEIGDFVYLPMKTYSSGMAARLRFSISAAATPEILIIDEALATGDATFREKSRRRVEEIRQQAGTVFLVSHSLATVRSMCTRVIWMHQGRIVMDGDPRRVTRAYKEHFASVRRSVVS